MREEQQLAMNGTEAAQQQSKPVEIVIMGQQQQREESPLRLLNGLDQPEQHGCEGGPAGGHGRNRDHATPEEAGGDWSRSAVAEHRVRTVAAAGQGQAKQHGRV